MILIAILAILLVLVILAVIHSAKHQNDGIYDDWGKFTQRAKEDAAKHQGEGS